MSTQTGTRTSADLLTELSQLLGLEILNVRWDPAPRAHEQGQPRGWWLSFGTFGLYLPSSDSLRTPAKLNAWRGHVLNRPDRLDRDVWTEPRPLDQADARQVVRLCHEIMEATR